MNITDPAQWPPGLLPLRFHWTRPWTRGGVVVVSTGDGSKIAEVTPLDLRDGALLLDPQRELAVSLAETWSLELIDVDGRVIETHVLWEASPDASRAGKPDAELAAWTALMIYWLVTAPERHYG